MEWPFFEMGIIILIFGPKAFKDYVYDCFKYMKWQSFFGAERYNWLLQDVEKSSQGVGDIMRIDDIFREVLRTWNPLDSPEELESLRRAIEFSDFFFRIDLSMCGYYEL